MQQDILVEYLGMIERGEGQQFVYIATTEKPKLGSYLQYTSMRNEVLTTHYLTIDIKTSPP